MLWQGKAFPVLTRVSSGATHGEGHSAHVFAAAHCVVRPEPMKSRNSPSQHMLHACEQARARDAKDQACVLAICLQAVAMERLFGLSFRRSASAGIAQPRKKEIHIPAKWLHLQRSVADVVIGRTR